jgi:hypothetical protein
MQLTLYREFIDCPLGHKPGWAHSGIRKDGRGPNDTSNFEYIAEKYSYSISYTTDIATADLVVFNLDRNHVYTHLNPILLLDSKNLQSIQNSSVPVVFWHAGECHSVVMQPWFTRACSELQREIWYVDSNYNTNAHNHLFFDGSEFFREKNRIKDRSDALSFAVTDLKYKFFMCTTRSDMHKHIIYNHLDNHHGPHSYRHYLRPDEIDSYHSDNVLKSFDYSTPPAATRLTETEIGTLIGQSAVIISLNSYFVRESNVSPDFFPLYITEKILLDSMTNRPVLPVGHMGSVGYYKNLGFDFPNWIDYSYDSIQDDRKRMQVILDEIDRLSRLDLSTLSAEFSAGTNNMRLASAYTAKQSFDNILSKIFTQTLV